MKLKAGSPFRNSVLYGAANRLVLNESLETKIQGLYGDLVDGESTFSYVCFISSPYLTDHVPPERLKFDIEEKLDDSVLSEIEVSFEEIRNGVINSVTQFLYDFIEDNLQRTEDRIIDFVNTQEPRYRSILKYLDSADKAFNPNIATYYLEIQHNPQKISISAHP